MAQADSKNSITAPDPTRRRLLAVAAVGSMVGTGSLAAAAMVPNDVPTATTIPPAAAIAGHNPVFGLIDAHRKANAAHLAAIKELDRLEKIHGFGGGHGAITQKPCDDENDAFEILVGAAATTVPGLLAKLAYLQDLEEWMLDEREGTAIGLIEGFVASIANVWRVQS